MSDAIWLPLFDEFADPRVAVDLAERAEAAGWDGFFVWDHIRWGDADRLVGDPWVTLAAIAGATRRIRLGPMVSPLPRYRPAAVVRQTVSLDLLSEGRLIVGAGLGADRFGGEYSRFGEDADARRHAASTDETLAILRAAWAGTPVRHAGEHHTVDDVRFLPTPYGGRQIPVWIAGMSTAGAPRRRAARHDGFVPVNVPSPDAFAEMVGAHDHPPAFDFVATIGMRDDGLAYQAAGATWILREIEPELGLPAIAEFVDDGPGRAG